MLEATSAKITLAFLVFVLMFALASHAWTWHIALNPLGAFAR